MGGRCIQKDISPMISYLPYLKEEGILFFLKKKNHLGINKNETLLLIFKWAKQLTENIHPSDIVF